MRTNPSAITDIEELMAKLLTPEYIEKKASDNNAVGAIGNLIKAAEIFENLEMFAVAEVVTKIIEEIPNSIKED